MDQEQQIMGSDLLLVIQGIVFLVEMDEPCEVFRISRDDVVLAFFGFG
jgi:hypothetical protein